ncbi:MAG: TIGR02646 family protein [Phycisphaeraceae bacterium]|nr:TIGR02646 family protein [Phycisphaeraceae bacterium]
MMYVRKAQPPRLYREWCESVRGTAHADYRQLPADEKAVLLSALIAEQKFLCAYTMRRISADCGHVEHIKPESLCRHDDPGSDLDYSNLVACYPRDGMRRRCRYGAQAKDSWWQDGEREFVSPLDSRCESRFRYGIDGTIAPQGNHVGAATTIEVLKLDHSTLAEDRKRVIEEFIYGPDRASPLSAQQTRRAIISVCARNGNAPLQEFCVAIRDALKVHEKQLTKQHQQRNRIQRSRRGR